MKPVVNIFRPDGSNPFKQAIDGSIHKVLPVPNSTINTVSNAASQAASNASKASGGWLSKLWETLSNGDNWDKWGKQLGGDSRWLGVANTAGALGLGLWSNHIAKQQAERQHNLNQANIQMGWLNNMRQWQQAQNQANRSAQESALAGASFLKGIGVDERAIRDHVASYIDTYGIGDTTDAQRNALGFLDAQRYGYSKPEASSSFVRTLKSEQDKEESERVKKALSQV